MHELVRYRKMAQTMDTMGGQPRSSKKTLYEGIRRSPRINNNNKSLTIRTN
jgi:hypothetical protein